MTAIHTGAQQTAPQSCDRCVARAAFLAHVPGGGELMGECLPLLARAHGCCTSPADFAGCDGLGLLRLGQLGL